MTKKYFRKITDTWQVSQDFNGYEILMFPDRIEYHYYGELHRENGPAVEYANGSKQWWINGKRHREDGPAIEDANGNKVWFLNGILCTGGFIMDWDSVF